MSSALYLSVSGTSNSTSLCIEYTGLDIREYSQVRLGVLYLMKGYLEVKSLEG